MGLPADNEAGYRDGSPITHAGKLRGNLLLIHGTGDDNCHYQGTERLMEELIAKGKRFSVLPYPNRTHAIREGRNTDQHLTETMTRFLRDNLQSPHAPAPDPVYETRTLRGWTLHVNRELLATDARPTAKALELLDRQLKEITQVGAESGCDQAPTGPAVLQPGIPRRATGGRVPPRRRLAPRARPRPGDGQGRRVHQRPHLPGRSEPHAELRAARTRPRLPRPRVAEGVRQPGGRRRVRTGEGVGQVREGRTPLRQRQTQHPREGVRADEPDGVLRRNDRGVLRPERLFPVHPRGVEEARPGDVRTAGQALANLRRPGSFGTPADALATTAEGVAGGAGEGRPRAGQRRPRGGAVRPAVPNVCQVPRRRSGYSTRPGPRPARQGDNRRTPDRVGAAPVQGDQEGVRAAHREHDRRADRHRTARRGEERHPHPHRPGRRQAGDDPGGGRGRADGRHAVAHARRAGEHALRPPAVPRPGEVPDRDRRGRPQAGEGTAAGPDRVRPAGVREGHRPRRNGPRAGRQGVRTRQGHLHPRVRQLPRHRRPARLAPHLAEVRVPHVQERQRPVQPVPHPHARVQPDGPADVDGAAAEVRRDPLPPRGVPEDGQPDAVRQGRTTPTWPSCRRARPPARPRRASTRGWRWITGRA